MREFSEGVRELHERVEALDGLLHERTAVADLSERRADAAHAVSERNTHRIRLLWIAGVVVAFLWTPMTAYAAVWVHERVRNTCLPSVLLVEYVNGEDVRLDGPEPWYCGIFPGTRHPEEDRRGPAGE